MALNLNVCKLTNCTKSKQLSCLVINSWLNTALKNKIKTPHADKCKLYCICQKANCSTCGDIYHFIRSGFLSKIESGLLKLKETFSEEVELAETKVKTSLISPVEIAVDNVQKTEISYAKKFLIYGTIFILILFIIKLIFDHLWSLIFTPRAV